MKKVLSVFLAVLMMFSALGVVAFAQGTEEPASEPVSQETEEETTRNILSNDGTMVVPINFTQLKDSFVFKIIEKIINFFLSIFGSDLDDFLSGGVKDAGDFLDEALSNIDSNLPNP